MVRALSIGFSLVTLYGCGLALGSPVSLGTPTPLQGYRIPPHHHTTVTTKNVMAPAARIAWSAAIDYVSVDLYSPGQSATGTGATRAVSHIDQLFSRPTGASAVAASSDAVYSIEHSHLVKRRLGDGSIVWVSGDAVSPPVITQGSLVYAMSGRGVAAFATASGKIVWRAQADPKSFVQIPGPSPFVFVLTKKSPSAFEGWSIHALDARTGAERWSHAFDYALYVKPPRLAEGVAFVVDEEGEPAIEFVNALDLRTGKELWSHADSEALLVKGSTAYFSSSEGLNLLESQVNAILDVRDVRSGAALKYFEYAPALARQDPVSFSTASDVDIEAGLVWISANGVIFPYALDADPRSGEPPDILCNARLIAGPIGRTLLFAKRAGLLSITISDQHRIYCDEAIEAYDAGRDPFADVSWVRGHVAHVDVIGGTAYIAQDGGSWGAMNIRTAKPLMRAMLDGSRYVTTLVAGDRVVAVTQRHVYVLKP